VDETFGQYTWLRVHGRRRDFPSPGPRGLEKVCVEFVSALLVSFVLIFAAELGDKSQLVALWFSTRYRALVVIAGVTAATLVVHLGSVAIGVAFEELLPERAFLTIVALSFFVFAAWGIRGDRLDDDDAVARKAPLFGAFGIVTISFFVSELGDKTQLATISLAGDRDAAGVWLGSTAGMVAADALAIFAGRALGKRLPQRTIAYGAAVLFAAAGLFTLWQAWR
jgi:putative Ca2+/H+ antiporter (TMEM165/GDT1 family)